MPSAFASSLFECDDSTSLRPSTGHCFIRKLPDDRSLGYLHKLHPPITAENLEKLQSALGARLPAEYLDFLSWSNGGSMFDNAIHLYGYVETFTRSIEPERQNPICIISENRGLSDAAGFTREEGWTRIGSAVGWDSKFHLQLHVDGACAITGAPGVHVASSFGACMSVLISRIGACFSCDGINDKSYAEIEAALGSLIRQQ